MVNGFGDSIAIGPGNLQVAKSVVVTADEIQQSYVLGFTSCRLHKNTGGTFITPNRYYDGRAYALDDIATMEVGDRSLTEDTISSKLVYVVNGDRDSGVALQGDRGPSGARGLKGVLVTKEPLEVEVQMESVALNDPKVLLERLVKWDLLEAKVKLEHAVKKVTRETLAGLVNKDL